MRARRYAEKHILSLSFDSANSHIVYSALNAVAYSLNETFNLQITNYKMKNNETLAVLMVNC